MTRAIDRRLSRIEGMRNRGDGAARIAYVASDALAEQLHAEARGRGVTPPLVIVTGTDQSPPVNDGGSIDDMLRHVAEAGVRIHDPLSSGPILSGRLWRAQQRPAA